MNIQKGNNVSFTTDEGREITAALDSNVRPDRVLFKQVLLSYRMLEQYFYVLFVLQIKQIE